LRAVQRGVKVIGLTSDTAKCKKMIEQGCAITTSNYANRLHNKIIIIDGKKCVVGSHNLTKNALGRNYEVSVIFDIAGREDRLYKFTKQMVTQNV
jgi:phosphatidylserine/phosphatidylglycerophosphate/cardiolipin synthase-like enzyme